MIRAQLWPHAGPSVGGNPYPYTFIDLGQLGWSQFLVNIVGLAIGCLLVSLAVFLIDRILPDKPLLPSR